ncbi:MAG: hypothetical protein JNM07_09245 [Phycisphaerae bacterium]|nr:hypothetical protein [Phycisphaerae bacterium]
MRVPIEDWQFWTTTLAAILAAAYVARGLLPGGILGGRANQTRATLTVEGKKPGRPLAR